MTDRPRIPSECDVTCIINIPDSCVYVRKDVCISVFRAEVCLWGFISVRVSVCVFAEPCMCVWLSVDACGWNYTKVCVRVCVCALLYVCVLVWFGDRSVYTYTHRYVSVCV